MHKSFVIGVLCCSLLHVSSVRADTGAVMPRIRGYADHLYVSATPTSDDQLRTLWSGRAIVVEPHDPALVPHKLALTRAELRALGRQGIAYEILESSFQTVLDAAYDSWMHAPSRGYSGAVPDWFERVQSLEAIFDYMDERAQQSQGRASVRTLGKAFEQELRVMRISTAPQDGARATILVTGTQHADEWLSPMVVTGLIWGLTATYDSDPEVKQVVDNLNVYVLPVMNPDSYARGNLARRTNRNPRCAGGVNLNRNWPSVGWGRGVEPCGGDNFAGEEALSEPETKAAKELADSLTQLVWYVDYHVTLDGCIDHEQGIADDETHAFFTRLMDESGAMRWGRVTGRPVLAAMSRCHQHCATGRSSWRPSRSTWRRRREQSAREYKGLVHPRLAAQRCTRAGCQAHGGSIWSRRSRSAAA